MSNSGVSFYGCVRDSFDHRDYKKVYEFVPSCQSHPKVDLRTYVEQVYDQGNLGSCTANALCAAYKFDLKKESHHQAASRHKSRFSDTCAVRDYDPSRLFLYYNARKLTNNTSVDSGCSVRDALKAFKRFGVCQESLWRYNIRNFKQTPNRGCYEQAKGNVLSEYERLVHQDVHQFRACLKEECLFVFGFVVYESFYSSANMHFGNMPMPTAHDKFEGRHAVMAVGYDDVARHFIILNSWGDSFGDKGYFYMPYDFIVDPQKCYDFWKITFAERQCRDKQEPQAVRGRPNLDDDWWKNF